MSVFKANLNARLENVIEDIQRSQGIYWNLPYGDRAPSASCKSHFPISRFTFGNGRMRRVVEGTGFFSWTLLHEPFLYTPALVSAPVMPVSLPTVPAPKPLPLERHLTAQMLANGAVYLSWDANNPAQQYVLYSSKSQDMADAHPENDTLLTTNWTDWIPNADQTSIWLAVRGVLHNGRRTRLSVPVHVEVTPPPVNVSPRNCSFQFVQRQRF